MFDVIIPIYRISKSFLERCLESVFDQTFEDYTVYVCDGTPVQHQDYDAKYLVESYGFVYVRQDPAHPLVSGARNQAVALGSNPYLAFLDGDDWWYSQYLEEIKQEIEQSSEKVAIWSCPLDCHVPTISQFTGKTFNVKDFTDIGIKICLFWKTTPIMLTITSLVIPCTDRHYHTEEAFESVDGYDERLAMAEDTELLMRIVGDPRKIPVEERRHYRVLELIVGFHYVGEENTCSGGVQTGANELAEEQGKNLNDILDGNMDLFYEKHPKPTIQDMPAGVFEILPEFAETFKGVMRDIMLNPLNI